MKKFAKYLLIVIVAVLFGVGSYFLSSKLLNKKEDKPTIIVEPPKGTIRYQDDFYNAVNEEEFAEREVPAEYGIWHRLYDAQLNDDVEVLVKKKIESDPEAKALYELYTDFNKRNALGITPIKPYVDRIEKTKNLKELFDLSLELAKEGVASFIVEPELNFDPRDSSKFMLSLGGAACYIYNEAQYAPMLDVYDDYFVELLTTYGYSQKYAEDNLKKDTDYSKKVCKGALGSVEMQDPKNSTKIYSFSDVDKIYSNIDLAYYYKELGYPELTEMIVVDETYHRNVNAMLTNNNFEVIKLEYLFNFIQSYVQSLDRKMFNVKENLDNNLHGTQGTTIITKYGYQKVEDFYSDDIHAEFVKEHFSEDKKKYISNMIDEIIDYYKENIENIDWLKDSTKKEAIKKLDSMKKVVGVPDDYFEDNTGYEIHPVSYENGGNIIMLEKEINKASRILEVDLLQGKYTKSFWLLADISPTEVNAFYSPTDNSINFPASLAYIFDEKDSYYTNLGKVGFIIGHEISHAFDTSGAQYDEKGAFRNWWDESDYKEFEKRSKKVIEYYNNLKDEYGQSINGELTVTENIADLGGAEAVINIAVNNGASRDELKKLFEGMAYGFASEQSRMYAAYAKLQDTHAAANARINGPLSSSQTFYDTYGVQEGDKMFVPKEDRVKIW